MQRNEKRTERTVNGQRVDTSNQQSSTTTWSQHQILPNRSATRTVQQHQQQQMTTTTTTTIVVNADGSKTSTTRIQRTDIDAGANDNNDLMQTYFQRRLLDTNNGGQLSAGAATPGSLIGLTSRERLTDDASTKASAGTGANAMVSASVFAQQCLQAHNECRQRHAAPPLALDAALAKHAQNWADILATKNRMEHSTDQRYGENVYSCAGFEPTGQNVVRAWYDEIKAYNFARSEFTPGTGHFTAVVWCESRRLGVGIARSAAGQYYVVANYDPPGNMMGNFERNVLPPVVGGKLPTDGTASAVMCTLRSGK